MSRIGKQPIEVPDGVKVSVADGQISAEGPKGKLSVRFHPLLNVTVDAGGKLIRVTRSSDDRLSRSLHGLTRTLIANMIYGVQHGYEKRLQIVGVGYQASLQGDTLTLNVGMANEPKVKAPPGIRFEVPDSSRIIVRGVDKQLVGQVAAQIRRIRPPEPYKGKGIRYEGEHIRKKAGKATTSGGGR